MADIAESVVKVVDFTGLNDNQDPRDIDPGTAQRQENLCCIKQGQITVRHGFTQVTFE